MDFCANRIQSTSSTSNAPKSSAQIRAKIYLESMLERQLRITTSDDRTFTGQFTCTDNNLNILLENVTEQRQGNERMPGMIIVPGHMVVKIQVADPFAGMSSRDFV